MVSVAVGLQARGKVPFADTFACFLSRAYDNVRMAAISRANINLCGSHCGVSIGEDGPSQMALEDIAMFRAVHGSAVFYPSDAVSAERLTEAMARRAGINYLRTSRPKMPILYSNDEKFPIPGFKALRKSAEDQVTVIGAGVTLHEALKAADQLKAAGIAIRVIDLMVASGWQGAGYRSRRNGRAAGDRGRSLARRRIRRGCLACLGFRGRGACEIQTGGCERYAAFRQTGRACRCVWDFSASHCRGRKGRFVDSALECAIAEDSWKALPDVDAFGCLRSLRARSALDG